MRRFRQNIMRKYLHFVLTITLLASGLEFNSLSHAAEPPALIPVAKLFGAWKAAPRPHVSADGRRIAFVERAASGAILNVAPVNAVKTPLSQLADPMQCITRFWWGPTGENLLLRLRPACKLDGMASASKGFSLVRYNPRDGAIQTLAAPLASRSKIHLGRKNLKSLLITHDKRDPRAANAMLVDVATGQTTPVPMDGGSPEIAVDDDLTHRLAMVRTPNGGFQLRIKPMDGPWRAAGGYAVEQRYGFRILGVAGNGKSANLIDTLGRDKAALVKLNLTSGERTTLYEHDTREIINTLFDESGETPLAVQLSGPRSQWVGLTGPMRMRLEKLEQEPGGELKITLCCGPEKPWVVSTTHDTAPERHFLFQPHSQKLTAIPEKREPLAAYQLQPVSAVSLRARDGLALSGYLILPPGKRREGNHPLVLLVHGGPVGRDSPGYHPQSQWLADRGYAVLRVNFRGSTGSGVSFIRAGFGEWGKKMQEDLQDATRWAIEQGVADPARIAIMGHSYGGYAALMGLTSEPSPYACGIAMSAVTDLSALLSDMASYRKLAKTRFQSDFIESQLARYRVEFLGDVNREPDADTLHARSPLYLSKLIVKPLLMVHGGRDKGVLRSHAWKLFEKLLAQGNDVAFLTFPKLGHRLDDSKSQQILALTAERFLAKCLGGRTQDTPLSQVGHSGYELKTSGNPL